MNWRILEGNDGAVIQLIVAGPVEETVAAEGSFEGQPAIIAMEPGSFRGRKIEPVRSIVIGVLFLAAMAIFQRLLRAATARRGRVQADEVENVDLLGSAWDYVYPALFCCAGLGIAKPFSVRYRHGR